MENNPIESLINSPITEGPIMEDVRHGEEGYVDMKAKMATKDLTVSYAKVQALKGVSLNISKRGYGFDRTVGLREVNLY